MTRAWRGLTTRRNEKATFVLQPDYGYGKNGVPGECGAQKSTKLRASADTYPRPRARGRRGAVPRATPASDGGRRRC